MVRIKKQKSAWSYDTSSSVGGQVSFIVSIGGGKGTLTLKHPSGSKILFHYASAGVGYGVGLKIKLSPSAGGALEEFPSAGQVYMTESFRGSELEIEDLIGGCLIVEGSAAFVAGGSVTTMLLGIPPANMQGDAVKELLKIGVGIGGGQPAYDAIQQIGVLESSAKAVLIMGGMTAGANVGAGVLGSAGLLWHGEGQPVDMNLYPRSDESHAIWETHTSHESTTISISSDALFNIGRFNIKPEAEQVLMKAARMIQIFPNNRRIIVNGHADSIPSQGGYTNQQLSEWRAKAVMNWFVSHQYVKASRISAEGWGTTRPIAPDNTRTGQPKNRRVEIIVLPK